MCAWAVILAQWTKISFECDIRKVIGAIEVNVCPLQGRKMGPHLLWNRNAVLSERSLSLFKVAGIPDRNCVDHQRECRCSVELGFISPIMKAALSTKSNVAGQGMQMFSFIQPDQDTPTKCG